MANAASHNWIELWALDISLDILLDGGLDWATEIMSRSRPLTKRQPHRLGFRFFSPSYGPGLIVMDRGTQGGTLHHEAADIFDFSLSYEFKNGRIMTGLTVVEYLLAYLQLS